MTFPYYVAGISITLHLFGFLTILYISRNVQISSSMTSVFHATLCTIMIFSVVLIYIENNYVDTEILKIMGGISTGYFSTDVVTLILTNEFTKSERIEYIIHHMIAFGMIYVVTMTEINCDILLMLTPITEISSLLTNAYILLVYFFPEYKTIQLINGVLMVITFVITRYVLIPFGYYYDFGRIHESYYSATIINMIFMPFMILNIFWGNKIFNNIKIFLETHKQ